MLFQDTGQAYHPAGGNAALCAVWTVLTIGQQIP